MPWFPVDDRFHSHPKAVAASLAAIGLWTVAGAWANEHLTDGDVPEHMIPSLSRGATELADELVTVGLWRRTKAGYRFHQWHERNATRSEVVAAREKKSSGGVLGNHRRWHAGPNGNPDPKCTYCGTEQEERPPKKHRTTDRTTDRSSDAGTDRTPTPPIPSPTTESSTNSLTSAGADEPAGWPEFWDAYPRKDGKAPAKAAYVKALRKPGVTPETLLAAATRYGQRMARQGTAREKIKMGQGWLNDERWNDETATVMPFERRKFAWEN